MKFKMKKRTYTVSIASQTPIEPGTIEIRATVTFVVEIG